MQLTDVIFTFYTPQGVPVGETDFTVQLMRPGYDQQVGVIQGETLYLQTDASGTATVSLAPSNTPYFVKVDGPDFCSQISYRFFVVESVVPVHFQDLVDNGQLKPADLTQETIRLIIEAKVQSVSSAVSAKASEINAKASEVATKASEDNALASETAAKVSETNTKTSETNAKASETNAKASETAASGSAFTATNKATEAAASASKAKDSEDHAKASEERTTTLKDSVEATAVVVQQTRNDMESLYNQAVAIGSGWAPVMRVVADGSRYVLQVTDWTGGRGTKPATGYMGSTGIVAAIGSASDIRGATGIDGTSFTVNATGTLAQRNAHDSKPAGFAYLATDNGLLYIRETATSGVWSPGIPFGKGDKGETGDRGPQGLKGDTGATGATGPVNKLTIGTVATGVTSSATITGTAPNQILNLTLQKGDKGDKGDTGLGFTQAQYDKLDGIEAGAQKNVATNLSTAISATAIDINSSTGTKATIPGATTTAAGLLTAADMVKLNGAAPLASPTFTGTVNAPTPSNSSDSTIVATTAFVRASTVKNGMLDIFGSDVNYVGSVDTAVAPYADANTFPPGTRVLAYRSFVANLPGGAGNLIYVETTANYMATGGRLQIGYGFLNGGCWMRWATTTNVYSNWQKFLMESGGNMEGQLGVLNQLATDNSMRAANTAFVQTVVSNAINSLDRANIKEPIATAAVTGSTRYSGRTLGAYFDGIYGGGTLGYPVNYGSRMLIVPRIVGSAQPQQEMVFEWNGDDGVGQDRVFYRSISDIPANTWKPYKEFAFTASPAFTGTPTAPTAATTTNTTQLATTAFVQAVNTADTGSSATSVALKTARNFSITGGATAAVKSFNGTADVVLDVTALDMSKATAGTLAVARGGTGVTTSTGTGSVVLSANAALTGNPTAPTAPIGTNTTQLATTAFTQTVGTDAKARANHTGPLNWAWATYGGTANTVTLAPAFARTAYVVGDEFRFRATATNTGATTINVNGLGAKTAVTVTGAALPAGYIRTGVDTVCVYDGTNFVVQRDMERGSNANGTYVKYADGTLECYGKVLMPAQAISTEVSVVWTHPSSFSGIPTPAFLPLAEQGAGSQSAVGILNRNGIWLQGQTAGTTTITAYAYLDARNFPVLLSVSAKGTWY